MKITGCGEQLTESMISEFEEQLYIKLPQDYKEFLLKNNGGTPEAVWVFEFFDVTMNSKTESNIQSFSIIYDEETHEYDDLRKSYLILQESGEVPPYFLPIADDPFGNLICMCVSDTYYGRIFFCDHELEDSETGYMIMSVIADSFTEFLDKLYISEDE